MITIIGVKFQNNGKMYYFDTDQIHVRMGDYVIVDTVRGADIGEVIMGERNVEEDNTAAAFKKVLRIATQQDIQHASDNRKKEKEAYVICQQKIVEHKLEMKLVSVEYAFDNSKILFYFTANGRVDFRSLVKDLASVFKTRIELRQIGVRDEAKMLGGLGPCGRQICCGAFLDEFQPVSIKMAKEQNLSLNPTKISGVCGRLMCCLKYEQDHYEQTRKRMPKVGKETVTPDGKGTVTDLNIVKETVFVRISKGDETEIKEYPLDQITGSFTVKTDRNEEGPELIRLETGNNFKSSADVEKVESNEDAAQDKFGNSSQEEKTETSGQKHVKNKPHLQNNKDRQNNEPAQRGKEKKDRQHQLGQPVRRENAKREDNSKSVNNPYSIQDTSDGKSTKINNGSRSNWSDALEKAIQEADRNR